MLSKFQRIILGPGILSKQQLVCLQQSSFHNIIKNKVYIRDYREAQFFDGVSRARQTKDGHDSGQDSDLETTNLRGHKLRAFEDEWKSEGEGSHRNVAKDKSQSVASKHAEFTDKVSETGHDSDEDITSFGHDPLRHLKQERAIVNDWRDDGDTNATNKATSSAGQSNKVDSLSEKEQTAEQKKSWKI